MSGSEIDLGFGSLSAVPGHHIAHFYRTPEEWLRLLVAYHKVGIESGDRCVYLMQPDKRDAWRAALAATGVDVERATASGQLTVISDVDDAADRIEALAGFLEQIPSEFPRLRSGGDVSWTETHWQWERHICTVEGPAASFLCQYDVTGLGGDVVLDAMRTHPICIVGEALVENPQYEKSGPFPSS